MVEEEMNGEVNAAVTAVANAYDVVVILKWRMECP